MEWLDILLMQARDDNDKAIHALTQSPVVGITLEQLDCVRGFIRDAYNARELAEHY